MYIVERRKLYDDFSTENVREIFISYRNKVFSIIVHSHDSRMAMAHTKPCYENIIIR